MSTIRPTFLNQMQGLQQKAAAIEGPWQISAAQQETDLDSLRNGHERFFFVVDLQTLSMLHQHGIERWLGYREPINLMQYADMLHPAVEAIHYAYAHSLLEKLLDGAMRVSYMVDKFITLHAIRKSDGSYVRVKRVSSAFQLNNQGQIAAYLNEFTLMGPYNSEPFAVWATDAAGADYPERIALIEKNLVEKVEQYLPFFPSELRLLRYRAHNPEINSNSAVAKRMSMSESWVKGCQCEIKSKAEAYFMTSFRDITEIAEFMRRQSLV